MSEPVLLSGDGGVRLEGRLFGSGEVGVALAHMSGGDQSQWFELAGLLANNGWERCEQGLLVMGRITVWPIDLIGHL